MGGKVLHCVGEEVGVACLRSVMVRAVGTSDFLTAAEPEFFAGGFSLRAAEKDPVNRIVINLSGIVLSQN